MPPLALLLSSSSLSPPPCRCQTTPLQWWTLASPGGSPFWLFTLCTPTSTGRSSLIWPPDSMTSLSAFIRSIPTHFLVLSVRHVLILKPHLLFIFPYSGLWAEPLVPVIVSAQERLAERLEVHKASLAREGWIESRQTVYIRAYATAI